MTDIDGRPVRDAAVIFTAELGGVSLADPQNAGVTQDSVTVTTNSLGVAQIFPVLGEKTDVAPLWVHLRPEDEFATQVSFNLIDARITEDTAYSALAQPFEAFTLPGEPNRISEPDVARIGLDRSLVAYRIKIDVLDEFDNPISNVPVDFAALEPSDGACGLGAPSQPARFFDTSECSVSFDTEFSGCGQDSWRGNSQPLGLRVGFTTGPSQPEAVYQIDISALNLPNQTVYGTNYANGCLHGGDNEIFFSRESPRNLLGFNSLAGEIGGLTADTAATMYYARLDENGHVEYVPFQERVVTEYSVLDGGGITSPAFVGNGRHLGGLSLGGMPKWHTSEMTADIRTDLLISLGYVGDEFPRQYQGPEAAAVDFSISSVQPEILVLDENGKSTTPIYVNFDIAPADYYPAISLEVFKNGETVFLKDYLNANRALPLQIPEYVNFEVGHQYAVQLVLNRGSRFELRSELSPVLLEQPIVTSVVALQPISSGLFAPQNGGDVRLGKIEQPLRIQSNLDLPDGRICEFRGITLNTTRDANMTVQLQRLDAANNPTGTPITLLDQVYVAGGEQPIDVSAAELGTGVFQLLMTAVDPVDGFTEVVTGTLYASLEQTNRLPVGHTMVKGVNLADGGMVLSRTDLKPAGRSNNLQFTRTYSSKGRGVPGPLGAGWRHNYMADLRLTPCGDVVLTTPNSGTVRFLQQGDTYVPAKGYHGHLQQAAQGGGMEYFAPNGMRYAFQLVAEEGYWQLQELEDTNGNSLYLEYAIQPYGQRLERVVADHGEVLNFQYQYQQFKTFKADVITAVTTNGWFAEFQYDEWGNLIAAQREYADALPDTWSWQEHYGYAVDQGITFTHLLNSVHDPIGDTTRAIRYQPLNLALGAQPFLAYTVTEIIEPDTGSTFFNYQLGDWGMSEETTVTNTRGIQTHYTLNHYGASEEIRYPHGTQSFTWETDTDVLLLSETDEAGRTKQYSYDVHGNIIQQTQGVYSQSFTYAPASAFTKPHIVNRRQSHTNYRGVLTTYGYDSGGNVTSQTHRRYHADLGLQRGWRYDQPFRWQRQHWLYVRCQGSVAQQAGCTRQYLDTRRLTRAAVSSNSVTPMAISPSSCWMAVSVQQALRHPWCCQPVGKHKP